MAILVITLNEDLKKIEALATKTGCVSYESIYPFFRAVYDDEKKRSKALDAFRKAGYQAEIEA